jgi:prefoldin subunit 5
MGTALMYLVLQELSHLTNSFAQLKQAQAKFKACVENVAEISPSNKGKLFVCACIELLLNFYH